MAAIALPLNLQHDRTHRLSFTKGDLCEEIGFLDVAIEGNTATGQHPKPKQFVPNLWTNVGLPLHIDQKRSVEYRLWTSDKHPLAFDKLYVFAIHG